MKDITMCDQLYLKDVGYIRTFACVQPIEAMLITPGM